MLPTWDSLQISRHSDWMWGHGVIPCKWKQKESCVTILIPDKIDFKTKTLIRDKEGHCMMKKESIQQEDKTILKQF